MNLKPVEPGRFKMFKVDEDTDLHNYFEDKLKRCFERGLTFFEFVCVEEDVNDDREVVLMN